MIFFFANRNRNSSRENIESGLKELESAYTLTPLDAGDFSTIRLNALMKFDVQQYRIEDLGNLSIMVLDSGVMQMLSFVITPLRKNMPLLSLDYVYLFGTQKGEATIGADGLLAVGKLVISAEPAVLTVTRK